MTPYSNQKALIQFQERIGYRFSDVSLLALALTHSSAAEGIASNERFEFLGDRVLGLIIADTLLQHNPEMEEGGLARGLNALVRKEACVVVAKEVGLGAIIQMDVSEERNGGREKKSVLGDACEALIAAIYRDGGLEAARSFILKTWAPQIKEGAQLRPDPKTALQEWAHSAHALTPNYEVKERTGPDHAPIFMVRVTIEGLEPELGSGKSKRSAEQEAAQALLHREGVWK
jgi:ribonuclease III